MNLYLHFAHLLDYPDPSLPGRIEECAAEFKVAFPKAAKVFEAFQHSQQKLGMTRLQEVYTATFDLQPECTLNLGYHLFGDDQRRGMFLAKLKELYWEAGIDTGSELPDHLCHLLRYVAARPVSEAGQAIVADCLLPAVSKIALRTMQKSDPYQPVLEALLLWLQHESEREPVSSAIAAHEVRSSVTSE